MLTINISKNLSKIYYTNPQKLIVPNRNCVINPISITNTKFLSELKSLEDKDLIINEIKNGKIFFNYQNIKLFVDLTSGCWPPTLDSYFFISTLISLGYTRKTQYSEIWDCGSGSGIVGIYLSNKNQYIKKVRFFETNIQAQHYSLLNYLFNENRIRQVLVTSDLCKKVTKKMSNVIIFSCPPYFILPPKNMTSFDQRAFGLDLLIYLVTIAPTIIEEVVLLISDLRGDLIKMILNDSNVPTNSVIIKTLAKKLVPYTHFDSDENLTNYLLANGWLKFHESHPVKYWHLLKIISIKSING